jgi:spore coat protein U-like protein
MAFGQSSASTNIPVSATVSQNCTITTASALAFGAYDPIVANATTALTANGVISIACSKGAKSLTIGISNGANFAGASRAMAGVTATNKLNYDIYQPPTSVPSAACVYPGTKPWNATGTGLLTLTDSPAKAARLYNVCGSIPGGQDAAADTYTDIVVATLNF